MSQTTLYLWAQDICGYTISLRTGQGHGIALSLATRNELAQISNPPPQPPAPFGRATIKNRSA
ncbi:hypothetical protein [Microcoleus sp. BROC3]|uniref:hypothetical protein n=1 Tax=Microcoleus sp. BROC3 TaxID=3055323 RepID=UPI002FD5ABF3